MKNFLLTLILIAFTSDYCAADTAGYAVSASEVFCFTSGDKEALHFELREYYGGERSMSAFVRYENSKVMIPLVLYKGRADDSGQTVTEWLEIVNGRINGYYEMLGQGAMVSSASYKNRITGKEHDFIFHHFGSTEKGCTWETGE